MVVEAQGKDAHGADCKIPHPFKDLGSGWAKGLNRLKLIFIMDLIDALWHFGNLLAPAVGLGLLLVFLSKILWAPALRAVPAIRLLRMTVLAACAGLVLGLLLTGRDGRMMGHGFTLAGAVLGLWWTGFVRRA